MVEKKRKLLPEITEALLRDAEERRIKYIRIILPSSSLVLILLFLGYITGFLDTESFRVFILPVGASWFYGLLVYRILKDEIKEACKEERERKPGSRENISFEQPPQIMYRWER